MASELLRKVLNYNSSTADSAHDHSNGVTNGYPRETAVASVQGDTKQVRIIFVLLLCSCGHISLAGGVRIQPLWGAQSALETWDAWGEQFVSLSSRIVGQRVELKVHVLLLHVAPSP